MTTTTLAPRPAASSNDRMRTADYHILAMPTGKPDREAEELDLARRAVRRVGGQEATELLDMLGLSQAETVSADKTPEPEPTTRRCTRCQNIKLRDDFIRHGEDGETLYSQCVACRRERRNRAQRALYAERGHRGMPKGDGDIHWRVTSPGGRGMKCSAVDVEARIRTWKELRVDNQMAPRDAAERMLICMRTARRYDRILKDRGLLPETDGSGRVAG